MENKLSNPRYSVIAMLLHWTLASALAFQIGLGWRMDELSIAAGLFDVTQLHKSIGIVILLLSIVRLIWRLFKPPPPSYMDDIWAARLSKITHAGLYAFMIGAPLTGWLMVSTSRLGIDTYLFSTIYWPHVPGFELVSGEIRGAVNNASKLAHEALAWIGVALFILHIVGALRHQYYKGEPLLSRMLALPRMGERRIGGLMILAIAFLLLGLFMWAQTWGGNRGVDNNASVGEAADGENIAQPESTDRLSTKDETGDKAEVLASGETESDSILALAPDDRPDESPDNGADPISGTITNDAVSAKPSKWEIIGPKKLSFSVKWNEAIVTGGFSRWSADIYFASNALEQSKITVDVDITSISTSDSTANSAIMGTDFFDTDNFPNARFTSRNIKSLGDDRYQMSGVLQMKNISRPSTIVFTLNEQDRTAKAKGSVSIDRIGYKLGETGYDEIANNVALSFEFEAKH